MPRTLLAVLVYNGRSFVPACLRSMARAAEASPGTDVLVLDDCSPEPGWSDELRALSADLGIAFYRSPRNLGIPRTMNLALLRAMTAGYDYVAVVNSDIVVPAGLVDALVEAVAADPATGSATPLSNDASIYSLSSLAAPLTNGTMALTDVRQDLLDWVSATLREEFGAETLAVPTGVGFFLFSPVDAVRRVGLFDPVFGRGYCEEVDWCLRAVEAGYRNVLAPSAFVYHAGRGSTASAGLLPAGHTTVWANERIVDLRHPGYRTSIESFLAGGGCEVVWQRAQDAIVRAGARARGYSLEVTALARPRRDHDAVRFLVSCSSSGGEARGEYLGATTRYELNGLGTIPGLAAVLGTPPERVTLFDRGRHADVVAEEAARLGIATVDARPYPETI